MESVEIINSLQLSEAAIVGLQSRIDWLDRSDTLNILNKISKKNGAKEIRELLQSEDLSRLKVAVQPHVETLLELRSTVLVVLGLIDEMQSAGVQMDMATTPTIAYKTLSLLTNLTILLTTMRNVPNINYLPHLFSLLDTSRQEDMKELNILLAKYSYTIPNLVTDLRSSREMLVPCVLSCGKLLQKAGDWSDHLLKNMLQSSFTLIAPDELDGSSTVTDTYCPMDLVKVAYFGFLLVDMPWTTAKDDPGYFLLHQILSQNLTVNLYRYQLPMLHRTVTTLLKKGKDKQKSKKLSLVKLWEEEANSNSARIHKDRRERLSLLLQEYLLILEDAPVLLGPKFLIIMTILAQASSEVRWEVAHHSFPGQRMERNPETVSLLYHITRFRLFLHRNSQVLVDYSKQSIRSVDVQGVRDHLSQVDIRVEDQDLIFEILDTLDTLKDGSNGYNRQNSEEFYRSREGANHQKEERFPLSCPDFAKLLCVLSLKFKESSSISKKIPQLSGLLEMVYLHVRIIGCPIQQIFSSTDTSFLYYFKDTLKDYFHYMLETHPTSLSYLEAFPSSCQDFPNTLQEKCPEEYSEVLNESVTLTNFFIEETAEECVRLMHKYCSQIVSLSRAQLPVSSAQLLAQKKKRRRKRKEAPELLEKKGEVVGERREEGQERRSAEEVVDIKRQSMMENIRTSVSQLIENFFNVPSFRTGYTELFPRPYLTNKLFQTIQSYIVETVRYPEPPSHILHNLTGYMSSLQSLGSGLEIHTMFGEALKQLREEDSVPFTTYLDKYLEEVLKGVTSPWAHFNTLHNSFTVVNNKLEQVASKLELLTSFRELTSLVEVFGVDGITHLLIRIQTITKEEMDKIFRMINKGEKNVAKIDIIEPAIQAGKLLSLVDIIEEALDEVSRERAYFLYSPVNLMMASAGGRPDLEVPKILLDIATKMGSKTGYTKLLMEEYIENGEVNTDDIVSVFSALLPVFSRLTSTRYHLTSPEGLGFDSHENNLQSLVNALTTMMQDLDVTTTWPIANSVFRPGENLQKSFLSTLILANSFLNKLGYENGRINYTLVRTANTITGIDSSGMDYQSMKQELTSKKMNKFLKEIL